MEFKIENGPVFTTLTVRMGAKEQIKAEAGAMVAMGPAIIISTQ